MKRTQIYLEYDQARELSNRARRRGLTASHVIREAIDRYLAQPESDDELALHRYRDALDVAFGIAPELPAGALYVDELRHAEPDRTRRLDARRRP